MGGWRVAQSLILGTAITLERLKKKGYVPLVDLYKQRNPFSKPGASPVEYI